MTSETGQGQQVAEGEEFEAEVRVRVEVEDDRTGMNPVTLERAVLDHLYYTCAKDQHSATVYDVYVAMAHAVRDRLVHRWMRTQQAYYRHEAKRVYYLSAEFLLGRMLRQNLACLGLLETASDLVAKYDLSLEQVLEQEVDPGLGNGGLGRLAACFMDSMASLGLPGYGYGIRYEFGIFEQEVRDGWQVEKADAWLRYGNPWEIVRHDHAVPVSFGGRVEHTTDAQGRFAARWVDTQTVVGVPYDTAIAGYGRDTVNTLRLWAAKASKELNLSVFNDGDYRRAVEEKALSESISKVLYPKDTSPEGKELRLKQQYFFVCCALHDILRRYRKTHDSWDALPEQAAVQLNDTHPAIAVAELMRLLVDREGLSWDRAWELTRATVAFTNHTLLSEALERWPVWMFERLLPRHLEIIYEINHRFLGQVHIHAPNDHDLQRKLSIIEEGPEQMVRMAHLAVVGSHSVNGVAELHSELIRTQLMPEFYGLWPDKFNNKTNGVTPRRWLMLCNPELSEVLDARIGRGWRTSLGELEGFAEFSEDAELHARLDAIKRANKARVAAMLKRSTGTALPVDAIYDVQIKRIHQYKRQLLKCLHTIALYQAIKANPDADVVPRVVLIGGKAAPGYAMAKLHIKLINDVAAVINHDPVVRDRLKLVFVPNYNVSAAEVLIPGTDLSEQISMAGKEASGTGNMKFAMNGALTIGTLDGANIEIREEVGAEHFFLFGLTAPEVRAVKAAGYRSSDHIARSPRLASAIDLIASGFFSRDDPSRFAPVVRSLREDDPYLICADFDAYWASQLEVERVWRDRAAWCRSVVHNIAHMGKFSSDRTIAQYAEEIWDVSPVDVHP